MVRQNFLRHFHGLGALLHFPEVEELRHLTVGFRGWGGWALGVLFLGCGGGWGWFFSWERGGYCVGCDCISITQYHFFNWWAADNDLISLSLRWPCLSETGLGGWCSCSSASAYSLIDDWSGSLLIQVSIARDGQTSWKMLTAHKVLFSFWLASCLFFWQMTWCFANRSWRPKTKSSRAVCSTWQSFVKEARSATFSCGMA